MLHTIAYGNTSLDVELEFSGRSSLSLEVNPDLTIRVVAPENTSLEVIEEQVLKKGSWIIKQLDFFQQFLPRTPERHYVSGETHLYLGRKYILKIRKSDQTGVKLLGGELRVFVKDLGNTDQVKRLLTEWYYGHAKRRFNQLIDDCLTQFKKYGIERPPLVVKRMTKRWGSCTPQNKIILNPEIIKAPSKCIEYVVVHELCHLVHPNHSTAFYDLQTEVMPKWEKWKLKLEKGLS
jgi:predicted metal-dependent hydrolase